MTRGSVMLSQGGERHASFIRIDPGRSLGQAWRPMTESGRNASKHVALLKALFLPRKKQASEIQRAMDLIAAIDAGGLPLHPARVNDIARQLGLEVSAKARMEDTILRIRKALAANSHN